MTDIIESPFWLFMLVPRAATVLRVSMHRVKYPWYYFFFFFLLLAKRYRKWSFRIFCFLDRDRLLPRSYNINSKFERSQSRWQGASSDYFQTNCLTIRLNKNQVWTKLRAWRKVEFLFEGRDKFVCVQLTRFWQPLFTFLYKEHYQR